MMATAARVTLAEVEHLVEPGEIEPDAVHTPGIFVRHILQGDALRAARREAHGEAVAWIGASASSAAWPPS